MRKGIVLIAWFLVAFYGGRWHYTGPYSKELCDVKLAQVQVHQPSLAYCTEAP